MTTIDDELRTYLTTTRDMGRMHMNGRGIELDTPYISGHDYVLDRGRFFTPAPLSESEWGLLMEAISQCSHSCIVPQHCYANAANIVVADRSGELVYVEGTAFSTVLPTEHAWVSIHDKVVDLTWRRPDGCAAPPATVPELSAWHLRAIDLYSIHFVGNFPATRSYFGVPMTRSCVIARLADDTHSVCLIDDWEHDWPLLREPRFTPLPPVREDVEQLAGAGGPVPVPAPAPVPVPVPKEDRS